MNYTDLRIDQLAAAFAQQPVAIVPWGALEWHSDHLPVGLDGLVAAAVAERLADQLNAIVLPPFYLPITPLPHRFSLGFRASTVRAVLDDLFSELQRIGCQAIVLLSGHYAQAHELVLMSAAEAALDHGLPVLALPPLALLSEEHLDHAGFWETSLLLATQPELVDHLRLEAVAQAKEPVTVGVLGQLPGAANAAAGEAAINQAVTVLVAVVEQILQGDVSGLQALYAQRKAAYQPFLDQFYTDSWETAAERWWAAKTQSPSHQAEG